MNNRQVVTYESPGGTRLNICDDCAYRMRKGGYWPKDRQGQELCSVYRGKHFGRCHAHGGELTRHLDPMRKASPVD